MHTHTTGTHRLVRCNRCYESAAKHVMETGIAPITRWKLPMPTTGGFMKDRICQVCGTPGTASSFHETPVKRGTCESAGGSPMPARTQPQLRQPGVPLAAWPSTTEPSSEHVIVATPTCTCTTCGRTTTQDEAQVLPAHDTPPPAPFGIGLCDVCESELPEPAWSAATGTRLRS